MSGERRHRLPWRAAAETAAEVRDEIESHIAHQVDDLLAEGWSREAAEDEARRRFGDIGGVERRLNDFARRERARERRRGIAAELIDDARRALRRIGRGRLASAAVVLVIGLGVGAAASVFALVDAALLRPLPIPEGDAVVHLGHGAPEGTGPRTGAAARTMTLPDFHRHAGEADFLAAAAGLWDEPVRWRVGAAWDVIRAGLVAGDPRHVLGREPLVGRWFSADEIRAGAAVALLDEETWRRQFGGRPDIVGTRVQLDGGPRSIIGVAARDTDLLLGGDRGRRIGLWLPLVEKPWMDAETGFLRAVGRLRPDVTLAEARDRAGRAARGGHLALSLTSMREVLVADARPVLRALTGGALFVLLACVGLGNLLLARSSWRGKALAVRAALGATRRRLLTQVLVERSVLAALGGMVGLLVAHLFLRWTLAASVMGPAGSAFDPRVLAFTAALSLTIGLAVGLGPAVRLLRLDLSAGLRDRAATLVGGSAAGWPSRALIAAEVALGIALVAATGLLARSLVRMEAEDPGFAAHDVLTFRADLPEATDDGGDAAGFAAELRRRVGALPGVLAVGVAAELPLSREDVGGSFEVVGRPRRDGWPAVKKRVVGPGYFDALRIPIVRGRDLAESDRAGAPEVVVISQAVARRHFPGEDPIGRRVRFRWGPGDEQVVVGVVGDVRHDGLDRPPEGIVYRPLAQMPRRGLTFAVRTRMDPAGLIGSIRDEIRRIDPAVAMSTVRTLDEVVAAAVGPRRGLVAVLGGFAVLAALLAAIACHAVIARMVSLRAREFALRMACGAAPRHVLAVVVREAMIPIGLGAALGLLGTLAAARLLAGLLYGVSPHDPATIAAATGLLAALASLAVIIPARRAARIDPMLALRAH